MSPLQALTDLLRRLPQGLRKTIYSALALLGALLATLVAFGVSDIGPISLTRALELYAYVSPAIGVVAVANVNKPADAPVAEFDEDVDLSAFEPVGSEDEVYGAAAW
ncbi:hypothetical protein EKO23_08270 [Nocardioides guangzhouensis]|uniref:Uncharacterized protein n=1 Tax=Nocardioides guangzhouensis TaxID=2497878 RepID=A0A4Q4ZES8_9ACTN|nr:hypothetical protein [Nocardioides guangzhouensis]RYP86660.1 hypothetical protein EKO23_08270 [Nocardioides guangzhouensis]